MCRTTSLPHWHKTMTTTSTNAALLTQSLSAVTLNKAIAKELWEINNNKTASEYINYEPSEKKLLGSGAISNKEYCINTCMGSSCFIMGPCFFLFIFFFSQEITIITVLSIFLDILKTILYKRVYAFTKALWRLYTLKYAKQP